MLPDLKPCVLTCPLCSPPPCSTHTACSSSLVATHLAHTGLLNREAAAAAACGVFMVLLPGTMSGISQLQALSPVGRCKSLDASADGYGRGEGCVAAVLQPASAATDGALALVRATVVNQAGRGSGLTAPNGPSQSALVSAALAAAGVGSAALQYVAMHGTGTPLGDPIEMSALGQALSRGPGAAPLHPLALGAVKSCYSHTEGAAGLTGTLLAVQAMHQQVSCTASARSAVAALPACVCVTSSLTLSRRLPRRLWPPYCTCATPTPMLRQRWLIGAQVARWRPARPGRRGPCPNLGCCSWRAPAHLA